MAKTIGKEKDSVARGRIATRAEAGSASDLANDEAQSAENVMAEDDDNGALDASSTDEATTDGGEFALPPERTVARRSASAVSHTNIPAPLMANPLTRFVAESYIELRKVTWPTWGEAWNMTLVVIIMSVLVAAILGLADLGLTHVLTWIVSLGTH